MSWTQWQNGDALRVARAGDGMMLLHAAARGEIPMVDLVPYIPVYADRSRIELFEQQLPFDDATLLRVASLVGCNMQPFIDARDRARLGFLGDCVAQIQNGLILGRDRSTAWRSG